MSSGEKVILHIRDYPGGQNQRGDSICFLYAYLKEKFRTQPPYVFSELNFLDLFNDKNFPHGHIDWHNDDVCGNKIEMRPEFRFILILKRIIK